MTALTLAQVNALSAIGAVFDDNASLSTDKVHSAMVAERDSTQVPALAPEATQFADKLTEYIGNLQGQPAQPAIQGMLADIANAVGQAILMLSKNVEDQSTFNGKIHRRIELNRIAQESNAKDQPTGTHCTSFNFLQPLAPFINTHVFVA